MRTETSYKEGHAPSYTNKGKEHSRYRHGMCGTPIYKKWEAMKRRCFNKNERCYKNYGSRGITVCERWLDFINFYEDTKDTFRPDLSLERIDNDGNYTPENCTWIPMSEQAKNKRRQPK